MAHFSICSVRSGKGRLRVSAAVDIEWCNDVVLDDIMFIELIVYRILESLRSNILFGEPFDEDKYTKVLHVCQLVADLSQLPAGERLAFDLAYFR